MAFNVAFVAGVIVGPGGKRQKDKKTLVDENRTKTGRKQDSDQNIEQRATNRSYKDECLERHFFVRWL